MTLLAQVPIKDFFPPANTFFTFGDLVNVLVKNVFMIAGVMLFILLIFGGLQFIISAGNGDKEGTGKGKNAITTAIIGFLLIIGSYWIVQILSFIMTGNGNYFFNPGV